MAILTAALFIYIITIIQMWCPVDYTYIYFRVRNKKSAMSGQLVQAYANLTGHFTTLDGHLTAEFISMSKKNTA